MIKSPSRQTPRCSQLILPFSRNLFSLPYLHDSENRTPTLHLDETPPQVLRLLLTLVHRQSPIDWLSGKEDLDHRRIQTLIRELFGFANRFDFDNLAQLLAWRLPDLPFNLFALANPPLYGSPINLQGPSSTLSLQDLGISENVRDRLFHPDPTIICGLCKLQLNRQRWRHHLELLIKTEQEFENDSNKFAKGCSQDRGGSKKPPCPTYMTFKGAFDRARQVTGDAVLRVLEEPSPIGGSVIARIQIAIKQGIHCPICSNRLFKMVQRSISKLHKQGWEVSEDDVEPFLAGPSKIPNYLEWLETIIDVENRILILSQDTSSRFSRLGMGGKG